MNSNPIVEMMVIFKYGIPLHSWVNPMNEDMASKIGSDIESSNLVGGLLSAILSFSESISVNSDEHALKQISLSNCTYQYTTTEDLIFFLGYDSEMDQIFNPIIDNFLHESVDKFNELYSNTFGNDMELATKEFNQFDEFLKQASGDERWAIKRDQTEILNSIQELLLDILGPVSKQIFQLNLKKLKYKSRGREIDLKEFEENIVSEISLLMDPSQAEQIGIEIHNQILK